MPSASCTVTPTTRSDHDVSSGSSPDMRTPNRPAATGSSVSHHRQAGTPPQNAVKHVIAV